MKTIGRLRMKTGETVTDLGLYASECCNVELIFDTEDTFLKCPQCCHLCGWELKEEILTQNEFEDINGAAA
jgi:hypothetical protein